MLRVPIHRLTSTDDERLADYLRLTDVVLRTRQEPERGLYIAESSTVIRRALAAGHRPRSFLMAERWLADLTDVLEAAGGGPDGDVPVFVAPEALLEEITGFHLHRGALAAMHRPPLTPVAELLAAARGGRGARRVAVLEDIVDHTNVGAAGEIDGPRRIAIFEDIVDHTNLGAAFRSAAALGVEAVLITPRCADPLYRRSIRVSMGTVFQVPWTRIDPWPGGLGELRAAGFVVAAMALTHESVPLDEFAAKLPDRLALVFGTEGDGLSRTALDAADVVVRIPMAGGVDSLNVAAAAAVAFWATRSR